MSNFIESNLGKNEKIVCKAKHNTWCIIPNIIAIVISILAPFIIDFLLLRLSDYVVTLGESPIDIAKGQKECLIPVILLLFMIVTLNVCKIFSIIGVELAITNKRVIGKVGLFSINALDFPINKIDSVSISASFWGRIFNYYKLSIKSTNSENAKRGGGINFVGIVNAIEFKNHITTAIEQHSAEARKAQAEEIAKAMKR